VGEQLDLFGNKPVQPAGPAAAVLDEHPAVAATPEPLPGQMDLFGDRWQRASAAHKALESFDLDAAADALREAVRLYPSDAALLERADLVARLAASWRGERPKKKSAALALAAIAPKIPAFLATYWHRRLAALIEEEAGAGAVLDGVPAGIHWLRAGDPVRAQESLRVTLAREPENCRARGYLADALFAQDRPSEARIAYREALAMAPSDVDMVSVLDAAVRDLPGLAEEEYELPGAPVEWAAAVGLLEGVFLTPPMIAQDWVTTAALEGLASGIRFYRWLVAERAARADAERIACRRAMKMLSPRLLKELLDRRG
jgi:tetratricopeptide (TPR) repeat protein